MVACTAAASISIPTQSSSYYYFNSTTVQSFQFNSKPFTLRPPPPSPPCLVLRTESERDVLRCAVASKSAGEVEEEGEGGGDREDSNEPVEHTVLTAISSSYNDIVIVDTPQSRMLLLDYTHNVHSIFNKGQKWTGSYWDDFASIPAIIPKGPIAILGLGGGTAAQLMLNLWPSLQLEGWEIDQILIDKARQYLGLSDLEKQTQDGGVLHVHVGDAFSSSNTVPGGYAGIVVDLFSDGKVLPQLQEVETWLELNGKLMPGGRLMVNCGGTDALASTNREIDSHPDTSSIGHIWQRNSTIKALCKAFPGQVSWKKTPKYENYMALTGPLPDLATWSSSLPDELSSSLSQWTTCCPSEVLESIGS